MVNTNNTILEDWQNESWEIIEKKRKDDVSLKTRFVKEFVEQKVNDENNKVSFIRDVISAEVISPDLKKELEEYAEGYDRFDELDLSKIKIGMIQRETRGFFVELVNKKNSIKEAFLREYEIEPSEYDWKAWRFVDELNERELKDLEKSPKSRKKFLEKYYGKNKISWKKDFLKSLENFNFSDRLEKTFEKINKIQNKDEREDKKQDLEDLANRFSTLKKLDYVDVQTLLEVGFFNDDEKKELVHTFLPNITLEQAKSLWIMTQSEVDNHKKKFVKENFFNGESVSNDEISAITNKLQDKQITVSTLDYATDKSHIDKLTEDELLAYKIGENISQDVEEGITWWNSVDSFKNDLKNLSNVVNAHNFVKGNVIVLKLWEKVKVEWKSEVMETTLFWDITDDWNLSWKPSFIDKWEEVYNSNNQPFDRTYDSLKSFIKNGNPNKKISVERFDILTKEEFDERVDSGQIKKITDELELKDDDYRKEDKEELQRRLSETRDKLKKEWLSISDIKKHPDYTSIQEKLDNLDNYNINHLKGKIDEVDSEGEDYWFEEGVSFETKDEWIYTISNINQSRNEISVSWRGQVQPPMSFEMFYRAFKDWNCKRTSNAKSFKDVFKAPKGDATLQKKWDNFELKWNSIQKEENDEIRKLAKGITYPYLTSLGGKQTLKIEKVHSDGMIDVKYWEYEEKKEKRKVKWKDDVTDTYGTFYMDVTATRISAWDLDTYIKKWKLEPRSEKEHEDKTEDIINTKNRKWSIFSKIFSNMSISEALAWGKLFIDSIENYMKEWNEEHAAKFASWVLWKLLPSELQDDLKTRVEDAWKKRMEDYIQKLKNVDSGPATEMIEWWLFNKNCPEYKKEAGVMFMMEKYGSLYAKKLYKHRWSFLWYEALWGSANPPDDFYKKIKEEYDNLWVNFTEEDLVFKLIKLQCKPEGFTSTIDGSSVGKNIKRRTRLHKEFKAKRNQARDDERQKGIKDANSHRTIEWRLGHMKWEFTWGTPANGMWALESIIWKWWSMAQMTMWPFVAAFSWMAYNVDESILDMFKNFPAKWMPIMLPSLMSKRGDLDMLNETILEVAKDIGDLYWDEKEYKNIAIEAQEIYDERHSTKIPEPNKVDKTIKFFEKYWEALTRWLSLLNTWKVDDLSKIDKLILIRKDDYFDEKTWQRKKWKSIYKKFYDWIKAQSTLLEYTKDEIMMIDSFGWQGTSWIDLFKATKEWMQQSQWWGFRFQKAWEMLWHEISHELDQLPKRIYVKDNEWEDKRVKEKLIKDILRNMLAWFLAAHWTRASAFLSLDQWTSPFRSRFNDWWIKTRDIMSLWISAEMMLSWDERSENLLDQYVENILTWTKWVSSSVDDIVPVEWVSWTTQDTVHKIMWEDDE